MTWSEFNTAVRVHLVAHNRRQGIQSLIDKLIVSGLWDLQAGIPMLKSRVSRVFTPGMLVAKGLAAQGRLPVGAVIEDVFTYETDSPGDIVPYTVMSGTFNEAMNLGAVDANAHYFYYDPATGKFLVTPSPKEDLSNLRIVFVAKQVDFENTDEVPFDDRVAEAVANYVMARLARQIDRDMAAAQSYAMSYRSDKRILFSEFNEASIVPNRPNSR
jgi:hypothetical protein